MTDMDILMPKQGIKVSKNLNHHFLHDDNVIFQIKNMFAKYTAKGLVNNEINRQEDMQPTEKQLDLLNHTIEVLEFYTTEIIQLLIKSRFNEQSYLQIESDKNIILTNRESECLFYLLRGKSAKLIAKMLNISFRTVEVYTEKLKMKFKCNTKAELIGYAIEQGYANHIPKSIFTKKFENILRMDECL